MRPFFINFGKKKTMAFKRSKNVWRSGNPPGRPRAFENPDAMMLAFEEYTKKMDANPWYEHEWKVVDKTLVAVSNPKRLPYTVMGFMLFCGHNYNYWNQFKNSPSGSEFSSVMASIEHECYTQKFTGASAGFFNANIIARDLGLRDSQDVRVTKIGKDLADEEQYTE